MTGKGWWRRNVWGVILFLPLTAGLFALDADRTYEANVKPVDPAPIIESGTAFLGNYGVRLTSLDPLGPDAEEFAGRDYDLPASVQPWRAVVRFSGPPDDTGAIGFCDEVALLDRSGRAYYAGPTTLELFGALYCLPDEPDHSSPYRSTFYFLLPADSPPQALRIVWNELLPRYVLIPVEVAAAA